MQKLLIILFSIFAAGCTAKYTQTDVSANPNKLDPPQVFTIATPVDGRYVDNVYSDSGDMTATAVRAAFSHHSNQKLEIFASKLAPTKAPLLYL
ncbi:hypothetical protein [Pseudomonas sp. Marseille-P9899]|uniref:hypothetical protein n=1 Tax=Pseudomonas sp. Marseille-P9899 TaxID=2730401 RepID=UPI00158D931F|nr:hypothetical protein [Pseudomonas sp. Marseille-P9899]